MQNGLVVFILSNFSNDRRLTNSSQPDFNPTFEWCWAQSELIRINPNRECSHANNNSNQLDVCVWTGKRVEFNSNQPGLEAVCECSVIIKKDNYHGSRSKGKIWMLWFFARWIAVRLFIIYRMCWACLTLICALKMITYIHDLNMYNNNI